MQPDPILRRVYRAKDKFSREVNHDPRILILRLREAAQEHPERLGTPCKSQKRAAKGQTVAG